MADRNILALKKLVYQRMISDSTLVALLGSTTKIRHANPMKNPGAYPNLVYNLISEKDNPYSEDSDTGISESTFQIEIFSASTNNSIPDLIEARVYQLFHNQKFGDADVQMMSCFRRRRVPITEKDVEIIRVYTEYAITNKTIKPNDY